MRSFAYLINISARTGEYIRKDRELNKISDQKINQYPGLVNEIESTSYKLIKPFGQPYNKTYIYRSDQKNENIYKTIEIIVLILQLFF